MKIYLSLFVLLFCGSCSTGPKAAGSENAEEPIAAQRQQQSEATVSPPNPIRLLRRSGDTLTDDPMAGGEVVEIGFFDENTGKLIKSIRPDDLNPYKNIGNGFELQPPMYRSSARYIRSDTPVSKSQLRDYLPTYLYAEIPNNWSAEEGIILLDYGFNSSDGLTAIPLSYWLEWNPIEEEVFSGNYAISTMLVIDKSGSIIFNHQVDGVRRNVVVSPDGKYLMSTYEKFPLEKGDSGRYVKYAELIKISDNKVVWRDSTDQVKIEYNCVAISPKYIYLSKRRKKEDSYQVFVVNTETDVLYAQEIKKNSLPGVRDIVDNSLMYINRAGDTLFYDLEKNSESFSIIEQ